MDADDLRRMAGQTGFDVATLEKDYALAWLVRAIYSEQSPLANVLIFKGGTAIRMVYTPEWRLSEDLDFTVLRDIAPETVREGFEQAFVKLHECSAISYEFSQFHTRPYVILARIQYLGPLNHKNTIKTDISLDERLVEEPVDIEVESPYEDIPAFPAFVYTQNEILVEKIRSIFQRGHARDYYDVWRLLAERDFDMRGVAELLIRKCELTGVDYEPQLIFKDRRLSEAKAHWDSALGRLTPDLPPFDQVVEELRTTIEPALMDA